MSEADRATFLNSLTEKETIALLHDWRFWARPQQTAPPGVDWRIWMMMGGRGAGKTRGGSEWIKEIVYAATSRLHIGLVGRTAADVRDVMIEGVSGILSVFPPWHKPHYEPSKRRITFHNGVIATAFSAEEPRLLRGPQFHYAWADELAAWRDTEAYDNLQLGLRLGETPQLCVTTTPRPIKLIKELIKDPDCIVTTESTYANIANLAPSFVKYILKKYQNTTLGQQELMARILDDVEGALWNRAMIEANRVHDVPPMKRIIVAVDPAVTSNDDSDETGIIVAGRGIDDHAYILEDVSIRTTPNRWARRAVEMYEQYQADRIIGEANNGGDLIEGTLRTVNPSIAYKKITATRGKRRRAEPVVALDEQGRVHHVGSFGELEDQMCTWLEDESGYSPDRMDARIWAVTELMLEETAARSGVW